MMIIVIRAWRERRGGNGWSSVKLTWPEEGKKLDRPGDNESLSLSELFMIYCYEHLQFPRNTRPAFVNFCSSAVCSLRIFFTAN